MIGGAPARPHYAYVDCLRGYAVLMVIACHLTSEYPGLPWRFQQLAVSGWFGVQLFFIASCLTLLMSWHAELERRGEVGLRAFFLRRYFRIAPAFYGAALLYLLVAPPPGGADPAQALRVAAFLNAWHPSWLAVPGTWHMVPGSWSISVEFTFYAAFPLIGALVTSLRRALLALALSLVLGFLINRAAAAHFLQSYPQVVVENFLFFWFPNQISVFLMGAVAFFLLREAPRAMGFVERHATAIALAAVIGYVVSVYLPLGKYVGAGLLPSGHVASVFLALFAVALSRHRGVLVNRPVAAMGQVSFSAYLLHFGVLMLFPYLAGPLLTGSTGMAAIPAYLLGFAVAVLATYAVSALSFRLVEQPGVRLGGWVIRRMRGPVPARA